MPEHPDHSAGKHPKSIIVFCDGTWNSSDQKSKDNRLIPTNVAKLFEAVCPDDAEGNPQIVHYIKGLGTRWGERLSGGGFGHGISGNIKEGYQFICSNYEEGDRVFLFGFSRGAYTARSIAGFINNVGILKRAYFYKLNDAYECYRDKTTDWMPGSKNAVEFQQTYGWPSKSIHFVGVWDTVGALGTPYGIVVSWVIDKLFKCSFHDVKLSSSIKNAYHAVAIDERRWPFRPSLWELSQSHELNENKYAPDGSLNFEQCRFAGVHSDVGGGYPETGLSDIALEWMADKARKRDLRLDLTCIDNPPIKANPLGQMHNSQTWVYKIATLAFVKIPSALRVPLPKIDPKDIKRISWRGDFVRQFPDDATVHPAVQARNPASRTPPPSGS
jgi:uncharacterized protein (DUF2235 family)